ncbi:MAG: 2-oxoacid:ferredoxin oxidoreductase subunit beta [Desulfovibrio sp.]|jgi:2-oxoglutarate ferredoxin oxidoreductase subunit beta|nr:2-oxoacid:ferredoxin oxidoreductase subunit beta [Desulfovibrio sp.]
MHPLGEKYLRKSALPTIFCAGCGDGIVLNAMIRVLDKKGGTGSFAFVSGIGCSSWIPVMINADVLHTLHGRAIAVATGLKLAMPDKNIVVFTGDGDCIGIGGNHLIHAARRNIDITVVMINNYIYGMTGGQTSPSTPAGSRTKTAPYGNNEYPFNAVDLVVGAGGSFAARETAATPRRLEKTLAQALEHKGFSFVEIMAQCPTQAGRNIFGNGTPEFVFTELRRRAIQKPDVPLEKGQFRVGILHRNTEKTAYSPVRLLQ